MRLAIVGNRMKMAVLVGLMNKLAGLPRQSTLAGHPPHPTIAPSPPGIGWTTDLAIPIRRLDAGAYAVELSPRVLPHFRGAMAELTQDERDWFAVEVSESEVADDDPDWFETLPDGGVRAIQDHVPPQPVPMPQALRGK